MKFQDILNEMTDDEKINRARHVYNFYKKGRLKFVFEHGHEYIIEYRLPDDVEFLLHPGWTSPTVMVNGFLHLGEHKLKDGFKMVKKRLDKMFAKHNVHIVFKY